MGNKIVYNEKLEESEEKLKEELKELINAMNDIDKFRDMMNYASDLNKYKCLLIASKQGLFDIVKCLVLNNTVEYYNYNYANLSALHNAVLYAHIDIINYLIDYLIDNKLEIDFYGDYSMPYIVPVICFSPTIEIAELLLSKGAIINLYVISNTLNLEVRDYLIQKYKNVIPE